MSNREHDQEDNGSAGMTPGKSGDKDAAARASDASSASGVSADDTASGRPGAEASRSSSSSSSDTADAPRERRSRGGRNRRGRGKGQGSSSSSTSSSTASESTPVSQTSDDNASTPSGAKSPLPERSEPAKEASAAKPSAGKASSSKATPGKPSTPAGKTASAGGAGLGGTTAPGTPPPGEPQGKKSKAGSIALILVIVLAIVVAVLAWFGWQRLNALPDAQGLDKQVSESVTQQVGQVSSKVEGLSSTLEKNESRVSELDKRLSSESQDTEQALNKVLEELSKSQQTDARDWHYAEAEYLLRLANQRLQLERDVNGADALLENADARIAAANNPALLPVRKAIQSELASLDSVPRVDRSGIYLALLAEQEQLARLPLKQDVAEIAAKVENDAAPTGGWQQQLARFGNELKDLVTVRRHDEALEALITPEQESYLRQNVRLVLEQAQLALLKEEPKLYQAAIDKAITLVNGYYDTKTDGVQNAVAKLEELKSKTIRPELPDISASLSKLRELIERRAQQGGGNA
ncbi:MAG: uroporphyrinogen-III C-methyltransferase [Cobetia sp.]|jgi:uroporphyrin-3 C-methyltransferase|uniref:uroporphyrinogen-III C-methyltransferase n=1 Tax=Cobetia TaxID=204286 RepID=UPI000A0738DE|nr:MULTISPECIES: uroporphyrinogen-III C-methyltransferase [Cobetia]UBU48848.1 uroporphyrinogen-III C-methyltransferase [Cobetia amphilecti]|tara:strand:+ start:44865 stop:46436 length:1572 start_codon:yes stop_codon:yes gene_type:complete